VNTGQRRLQAASARGRFFRQCLLTVKPDYAMLLRAFRTD
jgi:hypothetical protein